MSTLYILKDPICIILKVLGKFHSFGLLFSVTTIYTCSWSNPGIYIFHIFSYVLVLTGATACSLLSFIRERDYIWPEKLYIFTFLHINKSKGLKSPNLAGHTIVPTLPILRFGTFVFKFIQTLITQCGGKPCCRKAEIPSSPIFST